MPDFPAPAGAIEEVEWLWLRPHLERGALILVSPELELTGVAARIAADDSAAVAAWLAAGLLGQPTREQIEAGEAAPLRRFQMVIVQPFVLIQESPLSQEHDHV